MHDLLCSAGFLQNVSPRFTDTNLLPETRRHALTAAASLLAAAEGVPSAALQALLGGLEAVLEDPQDSSAIEGVLEVLLPLTAQRMPLLGAGLASMHLSQGHVCFSLRAVSACDMA